MKRTAAREVTKNNDNKKSSKGTGNGVVQRNPVPR
jgi:hypothetical protein